MMKRLLLLLLLLVAAAPHASGRQDSPGERAPALGPLRDLRGRVVRLGDYRGQVVLVNFWATWCPPCRAEVPELVRLQREYAGRGLRVVGVTHPPESAARVRRFARRMKINYPVALGTRATARAFGVGEILPVTVVIDRAGRVRARVLGILDEEEFEQKVRPLLRQDEE